MKLSLIIPIALSFSGALAAPAYDIEDIERRALNCAVISSVVNYFTKYTSAASSFCTAYFQITSTTAVKSSVTTTSTTTSTSPDIAITLSTTENVTTTTTRPGATINIYVTDVPQSGSKKRQLDRHQAAGNQVEKRIIKTHVLKRASSVAYPAWLPKIVPSSLVTSACGCYIKSPSPVIQTSTQGTTSVTVTSTATAEAPTTTTTTTEFEMVTSTTTSGRPRATQYCVQYNICDPGTGDVYSYPDVPSPGGQFCRSLCVQNSACKSFYYSQAGSNPSGKNICELYSAPFLQKYAGQCFEPSNGDLYDAKCSGGFIIFEP